jgi:MerR family transcriptional regulator, light-induced transcriptional regulator
MTTYSIKDLEHLSGIKAHTLRIWEQRYNFIKPKRTDTNIRFYDDSDLKLVLNVSLLKDNGYKISKIAEMTEDQMSSEVMSVTEKTLKYPEQIHALTLSMIDMDEDRFEKVMATNILQMGFESTMINVIYPFLSKIGMLWQTGAVNPAQEHFISNLIRQKLIVAIDGQFVTSLATSKKYLLYLPEGELHELSLLFSNYIIKARKNSTVYLGQSVPFEDLRAVHNIHRPDYIFTVITTHPGQSQIQEYINKLSSEFPDTTILLTGYQVIGQDLTLGPNMRIFNRLDELVGFVADHELVEDRK